ncbi:trp operon leader peptide [Streptomyces sp. NPDC049099]
MGHVKCRTKIVTVGGVLRSPPAWGRVPGMFAHSTRTWWWTAHPAAH